MSQSTSDPTSEPVFRDNTLNVHRSESGTTTIAAPESGSPTVELCPRCGGKLIDPLGLAWCKACGYCRATEEAGPVVLREVSVQRKPSRTGAVEFVELLTKMPPWLRTLFGGVAVIAAVSAVAHFWLTAESYGRALWSTIQMALGLLTILAGQIWALILLAPHDDRLGAKDLLVPFRLWSTAVKKVPDTAKAVWLGAWGLTAVLCTVFVIGGFSYWFQYYKPKKLSDRGLRDAVAMQEKGSGKSLEESVEDFANSQDLTKKKPAAKKKDEPKVDKRPAVQCVIIGYLLNEQGDLTGLAIATLRDGKLSFAGVVRRGLTPEVRQELMERLPRLRRPEPLFPGLRLKAVWVKPEVYCEVQQSGFTAEGHLESPSFKSLLH